MVNWVQVAKQQLVHRLAKKAGLQLRAVDVDDAGTVMNFWVPKDKLPASTEPEPERKKEAKGDSSRLAVVLLHGFAGDGIFTWALQVVHITHDLDQLISS